MATQLGLELQFGKGAGNTVTPGVVQGSPCRIQRREVWHKRQVAHGERSQGGGVHRENVLVS
jgi:hypothetical protein